MAYAIDTIGENRAARCGHSPGIRVRSHETFGKCQIAVLLPQKSCVIVRGSTLRVERTPAVPIAFPCRGHLLVVGVDICPIVIGRDPRMVDRRSRTEGWDCPCI